MKRILSPVARALLAAAERSRLPDGLVRRGIRILLARRLRRECAGGPEARAARKAAMVQAMRSAPIAVETDAANRQHYEVPATFYQRVLGPRLKYSACLWPEGDATLAAAEEAMLALTCERAELSDGQRILELGCGWGSLTLWMAEHYPASRITAVSNSHSQAEFIRACAAERGLGNVECMVADVREYEPGRRFDRVVSVEMFEHMRNWGRLLHRVAGWLLPGGKLFIHIFCHRECPYFFQAEGAADWMGRNFFTGGLMPSEDLPAYFQDDLSLEAQWRVDGRHYARTCRAWLQRLDDDSASIRALFAETYGRHEAALVLARWRLFFMACEELFAWNRGGEWFVAHYRFAGPREGAKA